MFLLDKFKNKYFVYGTLIAESPLHIGAGNDDFKPTAVDAAVIRDENNNPYIPGTSLKGILRSTLERIISSGVFENLTACNILVQKNNSEDNTDNYISHICVDDKKIKEIKESFKNDKDKEKKIAERIYEEQCDICKLFGGHGFASKIQISDARVIIPEGGKIYTQIRDGVAIDRDTLTHRDKVKYNFEQVAVGTEFKFEMAVDNLEEEHKILLALIISLLEKGDLKIGGKTSAGLGNIKLVNTEIGKIDNKETLKEYYLENKTVEVKKEELLKCLKN